MPQQIVKFFKHEPENVPPRGIKREADPMTPGEFAARYKQRRLDNGKFEIDLTED